MPNGHHTKCQMAHFDDSCYYKVQSLGCDYGYDILLKSVPISAVNPPSSHVTPSCHVLILVL